MNRLTLAIGDASILAQNGDAVAGFEWLNEGLYRALLVPAHLPWRDALVERWGHACEDFAAFHQVRLR